QTTTQTPKLVRVGILLGGSLSSRTYVSYRDAFLQDLRRRGWEGKKLILEERAAEGRAERFAEHAAELVTSQVDVAVGTDSQAIQALKEKTSTIPIVIARCRRSHRVGLHRLARSPGR
ncbi:MAG TPA: ABC transporter substrate binding protein, partial [Gemmatimonadales bacterium]|nr:ABC transporter substrate binding protein [Gemmatimonadales bacterium]